MAKRIVPGGVLGKFTVGRENFILRYGRTSDVKLLLEYINSFVPEKAFLSIQKKITLGEEKAFVSKMIKDMKESKRVYIVAEAGGRIIASASVVREEGHAISHVGTFGIAVAKKYRGMGIGRKIAEAVLSEAKKKMGIEIAKMSVVAVNAPAIKLYERLGFRKFGSLPGGYKHFGKKLDFDYMYKKL